MPHGRDIRAYMDVFTACPRRRIPIHVSDSIKNYSSRQCKSCRQISKVSGTAVKNIYIKDHRCATNKKKLSKQADVAGLDKCGTNPRHEADTSTIDTP